ncbi:unnamed protein product [Protopolystoma xenopodis]|uniref:Uncharacterized protein n=1 Tax=Protopolystoma xenopodis TaxID=117903 RepID=A0A3S5B2H2_9PLAT|nr:unnamed protein product [Protopolystoma xenopodis]
MEYHVRGSPVMRPVHFKLPSSQRYAGSNSATRLKQNSRGRFSRRGTWYTRIGRSAKDFPHITQSRHCQWAPPPPPSNVPVSFSLE